MAAEAEKLNLDNIIARLLEGIVFGLWNDFSDQDSVKDFVRLFVGIKVLVCITEAVTDFFFICVLFSQIPFLYNSDKIHQCLQRIELRVS